MHRHRLTLLCILSVVIATGLVVALSRRAGTPARPTAVALGSFTAPPPPAEPAKQLRPELAEALGYGPVSPWNRRTDLIRKLPSNLTAFETDALLTALMERCPPSVSTSVHATYIHEIAVILQPRAEVRRRFADALAALALDTGRDATTRDYAIQHLRQAWTRAADDPALRASIVHSFRECTRLDSAVATSALLSLHVLGSTAENRSVGIGLGVASRGGTAGGTRNLESSFQLPDSDLVPLLKPIFTAKTSTSNIAARLTAIRIASDRRLAAFREPLLTALNDRSEHALVRMAAANAIGRIADPSDLQTLAKLEPSDDLVANAIRLVLRADASR